MDLNDLPLAENAQPETAPKRKRGRPKSPYSMSNAERQKKWREWNKPVNFGPRMGATIETLAKTYGLPVPQVIRALVRFALLNRNWVRLGFPPGYMWEGKIKDS